MNKVGRYNILGTIGKGGMGVVYRALDSVLKREVALKTHTIGPDPDINTVERFLREARVVASFKHRNIVTVFDLGQDRDKIFIAMELLEGEDLTSMLSAGRHVSLEKKLHIIESIGKALAHAHDRGIIHRDIKPRNVFVTDDGEVKLLDFGLAYIAQSTLTEVGQIIGTPFYMSPEQVLGEKATARSDIFSLGTLFYELLTGERAFGRSSLDAIFDAIVGDEPKPIREVDPALPEELARIVAKMMRKSPHRRHANVDEVLRDLAKFQSLLGRYKSRLRDETDQVLKELASLARNHAQLVAQHEVSLPSPELPKRIEREDVSYMSLVGLRDGANLQLRRLEVLVEDFADEPDDEDPTVTMPELHERPAGDARERERRREAEKKFRAARAQFGRGELAASLRLVCESLRLDPDHPGAGALAEKVRLSIVALADSLPSSEREPKHFDVLVAALLAIGEPGGERNILEGRSAYGRREIAGLSDILLSGLPAERTDPDE